MQKYTTEYIEKFLENNLDTLDHTAFENELSNNEKLRLEVELQRNVMLAAEITGFKSSIQQAHNRFINLENGEKTSDLKSKSNWTFIKYFGILIISAAALMGLYKIISSNTAQKPTKEKVKITATPKTSVLTIKSHNKPEQKFNSYSFIAEKGAVINDPRSGAQITIKPNSLIFEKTGLPVKGKVTLDYREFRNQADIALSEIPMNYKNNYFNSAGMLEIRSRQGKENLKLKNNASIDIDFKMTKNEQGIDFYKLNDKTKTWEQLHSIDKITKNTANTLSQNNPNEIVEITPIDPTEVKLEKPELEINIINTEPYFSPKILGVVDELQKGVKVNNIVPVIIDNGSSNGATPEELFFNTNYKKPVGDAFDNTSKMSFKSKTFEDPKPLSIGLVSQKNVSSKRIKRSKSNLKKPTKVPEWSYPFSIATVTDTVTIFDNSSSIFFKELEPLMNWVFYDKENKIYRGDDIFDIRIDIDSTNNNKFFIHLKHPNGIATTPVSLVLGKANRQIIKRRFDNYVSLRNARMQRIIREAEILKRKAEKVKKELTINMNKLDELMTKKDDRIYAIAQLSMSDDELMLSKDEWFEKISKDPESIQRLKQNITDINNFNTNKTGASEKLIEKIQQLKAQKNRLEFIKKVQKLVDISTKLTTKANDLTYSDYSSIKIIMSRPELLTSFTKWKGTIIKEGQKITSKYQSFIDEVDTLTNGYQDFYLNLQAKYYENIKKIRSNNQLSKQLNAVNETNRNWLAKRKVDQGLTDAGHYKDPLVRKLSIDNFGVYNCDQVYRLANAVNIKATYKCNGQQLTSNRVLTVIDKKINGAISFNPRSPTMSTSSKSCLLLVTKSDEYYFYSSQNWDKNKPKSNNENFCFNMINITDKLNKPEDLQTYIEKGTLN